MQFVDLPEQLPRIVVDRIMIEQVLHNLIKNGIEAMSDVPVDRRQLTLQARPVDARTLQVTVADHGHGLAGVDMEKIFAPFYTTKPDGSGIGLSLSRRIMQLHGGSLRLTCNTDRRVTFTLQIG